jgi:hypothetical protein
VVDDWITQEIKIVQRKDLLSLHEFLFYGTEKECKIWLEGVEGV